MIDQIVFDASIVTFQVQFSVNKTSCNYNSLTLNLNFVKLNVVKFNCRIVSLKNINNC